MQFISVEWLTDTIGLIRHHPGGEGYGSAYDFVCVLVLTGVTGEVELKGALGHFTATTRRLLTEELQRHGFMRAVFDRRRHGTLTRRTAVAEEPSRGSEPVTTD